MAKTITALYDTYAEAQNVVQDLVNHGFPRDDISIIAQDSLVTDRDAVYDNETSGAAAGAGIGAAIGGVGGLVIGLTALAVPGVGPVLAAGPLAAALIGAGVGAAAGGIIGALTDLGVPEEEAHYYAEGVRRGGVLVTVKTSDDMADRAVAIASRHHPIDIDERVGQWRQSGWNRFDPDAQPYMPPRATADTVVKTERARTSGTATGKSKATDKSAGTTRTTQQRASTRSHDKERETTIPVVEEELQVGKRQTERGVRVHSVVTSTPVEEKVRLREEHVSVERRPVDRPVSAVDADAFKEKSFEVTAKSEEAVVSKRARVVEEVVVHKDVQEHTETVRDTVRRTDVEVEQIGTAHTSDVRGFDTYDADFRRHYGTAFGKSGSTYEHYQPAYRHGYTLGTDKRYTNRDWTALEPEFRRSWEERQAGTWDQYKDAIRHGWDKVRGQDTGYVGTAHATDTTGFNVYDADFRRHYSTTFGKSGSPYDYYMPAYRYGYTLGTDKRYTDRDWTALEPEFRRSWAEQNQGPWEDFKDAIRYAWDKVRGRR
jgi:stress response protein YsnF/uncharacterized membrane protein